MPSSSPEILDFVMDKIDLILVMTVNPGFGGQKFLPAQLQKIKIIRDKISKYNHNIDLEVDGGINDQTAALAISHGADVLVSGSYIFADGKENYARNIAKLKL